MSKVKTFLEEQIQLKELSPTMAFVTMLFYSRIKQSWKYIKDPDIGVTPNGDVLFSWNSELAHFEIELYQSGFFETFYMDHRNDKTWIGSFDLMGLFEKEFYL